MKKLKILSSATVLLIALCALNVNLGSKGNLAKTSEIIFTKALACGEMEEWIPDPDPMPFPPDEWDPMPEPPDDGWNPVPMPEPPDDGWFPIPDPIPDPIPPYPLPDPEQPFPDPILF